MDKKKRENSIAAILVLALIVLGFISMCIGQGTEILRERGVLPDNDPNKSTSVDWSELYPFKPENAATVQDTDDNSASDNAAPAEKRTIFTRFRNLITKMKKLEGDCEDCVLGYRQLLELSGKTNKLLGKTDFSETNGITLLNNGHLASIVEYSGTPSEIDKQADSICDFADWLDKQEIGFLYVQIPTKICRYDDSENVAADNTNVYYDSYVDALLQRNVETLDLRELIHEQNMDHYSMFYPTDAHWTLNAGRWAAGEIANKLNSMYNWNLDTTLTDDNMYETVTYEDSFLGYYGRIVTLGYAEPDDFTIYYPKFSTDLRVVALDKEIDQRGALSKVMYNYGVLDKENFDYYDNSAYESTAFGNRPLFQITNNNADNDVKVLVIRNSFSLATIPFLSVMVLQSDWIDIRPGLGNFNGSIKTYVEETQPDVVILMYDIMNYEFN